MNSRLSKKRQGAFLDDLVNSCSRGSGSSASGSEKYSERICFKNSETALEVKKARFIFDSGASDFSKCIFHIDSKYDWHKVTIFNERKIASSKQILSELFRMVDGEFFAPIAYRSSKIMDTFFVLGQGDALKKFFENQLFVQVGGVVLKMEIQMCVEKLRDGMIIVGDCVKKAILESFNPIFPDSLDLSYFRHKIQLADIRIELSNPAVLSLLLCELSKLAIINGGIKCIKKLILKNNNISSLEPFVSLLEGFHHLKEIDLQFNQINSMEELKNLRTLRLKKLCLIGNPVEAELQFGMGQLISALTTLQDIDKNSKYIIDVPKQRSEIEFDNQDDDITNFVENPRILKPDLIDDDMKQNFDKYYNNNMWTQIYVFHKGDYDYWEIVGEIIKLVNPYPFYPCYYKYEDKNKRDSFFVYGHFHAINVLINHNLKLKISANEQKMGDELKINISLNCAEFKTGQLHWQKKINYVIDDRVHSGELNLKNFADDDKFRKILISFSSRHLVNYVMNVASLIDGNICVLNLSGNQITHIDDSIPDNFSSIDLSQNCLQSFSSFSSRRRAQTVYLDRNPLCEKYLNDPLKYLREVKKVFPDVKTLDGLQIEQDIDMATFQNFLVSPQPKLYSFVEYFIKFYFELYDSDKRIILSHSYDADAIMTHYMHENDVDDGSRKVFYGSKSVENYFKVLPLTQHDLSKINVDVPLNQSQRILIVINGIFKELPSCELYKFSRNLLIEKTSERYGIGGYKFVIRNDLFQSRKINQKSNEVHCLDEVRRKEKINEFLLEDYLRQKSQDDEVVKISIIRKATKLREENCLKLLQDAKWNIKAAIEEFNKLFDHNKFNKRLDFEF